jgi:hypothetical protein
VKRESNAWSAGGSLWRCCILLISLWSAAALAAPANAGSTQSSNAPNQDRPNIQREVDAGTSRGCVTCHTTTDQPTMHASPAVTLGCTDCHGGNASVSVKGGTAAGTAEYRQTMERAHVLPRDKKAWHYPSSANPPESYTLLNHESPEFIRFMNPSDYRIVDQTCGTCHAEIVAASIRSMHSTGAMFWGGASYNNGILSNKQYFLGESYDRLGHAAILHGPRLPDSLQSFAASADIVSDLLPLPSWETVKPGDIFRVFERGGRNAGNLFPETGLPDATGKLERLEEPGRPDIRQSNRGPGTGARISIPVLNITKTRLNDPLTWFMGTNDQPGDYRQSGCAACHVVYANDREKRHSGPYAAFGHDGQSHTLDPTISKSESGHPIQHAFTRAIPTSQCIVCHLHQPNMFLNSFLGYTMWDYESDAPAMWPKKQQHPSVGKTRQVLDRNPEGAAPRGNWADVNFLSSVADLNPQLKDTQFADYHGHGWNFRAVFKRDRKGNLLDEHGKIVPNTDPDKFHKDKAVLLSSIHLDKGMHCVDCHFSQDNHGNGYIYGEVAAAVEIDCKDCHGTATQFPNLYASGPAALGGGTDLTTLRTPDGRRRFEWVDGELFQRSMLYPDREWRVSLVKDTVTVGNPHYNPRAARAKLMGSNTSTLEWGSQVPSGSLAHSESNMECYSCHTSWTTSCGGCHLPIEANWKTARHHYEGGETRNYATYNPQVARDDMFLLGLREPSAGGRIAPLRSSSALVLSSTNANREHIYVQQPPISASGYSSQAFNPHYPHTERTTETKACMDCHLSQQNDNNAIMAQLLALGTNFVNFVGLNTYVGGDGAVSAIKVTEWEEPQAVIGSYLHKYAYPDWYAQHQRNGQRLRRAAQHGAGTARCIQLRGEYLYVAEGPRGMRVYDVASIDNKGVSQRLITAPASPLGQDTHIASVNATCVALPTNQPVDPPRSRTREMQEHNLEQPMHPLYDYAYITDAKEGLILTNVDTLSDREPRNNFLKRALTWNPGGILNGARHITIGGSVLYVTTPTALVVISVEKPLEPKLLATVALSDPRASALQFRYLFVTDAQGLETIDVTHPEKAQRVANNVIPMADAQRVYVARTYAYVAAGAEGLVIVDASVPTALRLYMRFDANGRMRDARDVIVASTNASLFGYVADGRAGLKVLQLTSPESQPNFYGFSPEPCPQLIAYYPTARPALSLSKGLDRDRAVDETGHQIAVFGRRGSRPLALEQMQRMYLDEAGKPWVVRDTVSDTTPPEKPPEDASTCRPPKATLADADPLRP